MEYTLNAPLGNDRTGSLEPSVSQKLYLNHCNLATLKSSCFEGFPCVLYPHPSVSDVKLCSIALLAPKKMCLEES